MENHWHILWGFVFLLLSVWYIRFNDIEIRHTDFNIVTARRGVTCHTYSGSRDCDDWQSAVKYVWEAHAERSYLRYEVSLKCHTLNTNMVNRGWDAFMGAYMQQFSIWSCPWTILNTCYNRFITTFLRETWQLDNGVSYILINNQNITRQLLLNYSFESHLIPINLILLLVFLMLHHLLLLFFSFSFSFSLPSHFYSPPPFPSSHSFSWRRRRGKDNAE